MQTAERTGQLWSTAPADWAAYQEPTFIPLYKQALKSVELNKEKTLLDIGCGAGLFLNMAAATGAEVYGIDAARGLLAIARRRLPGAPLLLEDLEDLPFGDDAFDVVTGFNSFQYGANFSAALAEARRVVKRHGNVVIGIWGSESDCEGSTVMQAVAGLLPRRPGTREIFARSEDGVIEGHCKEARLKLISRQRVACPWRFAGEEQLQRALLSSATCAKAVLYTNQFAVMDAIAKSAAQYKQADESYYLKNQLALFITEKI